MSKNFNTGIPVDIGAVEDINQALTDFSEGSETLRELLFFCNHNSIKTQACCAGHGEEQKPYISIFVSEGDSRWLQFLIDCCSLRKNISTSISVSGKGVIVNIQYMGKVVDK